MHGDYLIKDIDERVAEKHIASLGVLCPSCFAIKGSKYCCSTMRSQFKIPYNEPICDPAYRLSNAIMQAREISVREHIKADRFERVGHFATCIRREFARSEMGQILSNKALWYDIGKLEVDARIPYNNSGLSMDNLQSWLEKAERIVPKKDFVVSESLASLDRLIKGATLGVSDASRINTEAEVILNSLKEVLQEV